MNARTLMIAGAVVVLAASPVAMAKTVPIAHPAKPVTKHVVRRHVTPRVLCICETTPRGVPNALSEAELEAQIDADMISHGLDPLYGPTMVDSALEAEYDANLVRLGLNPVFTIPAARSSIG